MIGLIFKERGEQVSPNRTVQDEPQNFACIPSGRGPWVRAEQLPYLFCSWDLAYRCTKSGWLKPVIQGKRRTIYRLVDVMDCIQRIEAGELPPRRSKGDVR